MTNLFRKKSLENLISTEQLDRVITVVKPSFWLVFLGAVVIIVAALIWGFFGNLPVCLEGTGILAPSGNGETVFCYLPVESGKQVQEGMEVTFTPSGINWQQESNLTGRVVQVDSYVANSEEMQTQLNNETLVQRFLQDGPVVAIECQIEKNEGADFPAGTLMDSSIVIERKSPLSLLLPSVLDGSSGEEIS